MPWHRWPIEIKYVPGSLIPERKKNPAVKQMEPAATLHILRNSKQRAVSGLRNSLRTTLYSPVESMLNVFPNLMEMTENLTYQSWHFLESRASR